VDLQTEELTGVKDRRCIMSLAQRELQRALRYRQLLTICILDLNGLKQINDSMGHGQGDGFIKSVATTIGQHIRESDAIGRIGGDEFLILFPQTKSADAELILQRALTEMSEGSFSYGLCTIHSGSSPKLKLTAVLERADQRMYSNKKILKTRIA